MAHNPLPTDVQVAALVACVRRRSLYLPKVAWMTGERVDWYGEDIPLLVKFALDHLLIDPLMMGLLDTAVVTPYGRKFENGCDLADVLVDDDPLTPERTITLRHYVWSLLLTGGKAGLDNDGNPVAFYTDLPVMHLFTCGVVTDGKIPTLSMWDAEDETTPVHALSANVSCACGAVTKLPMRRAMRDDEVSGMLDAVTMMTP